MSDEMEPIAIIGMSCRFPGAPDPQAFWDLLLRSGDAITEVPPDRYDVNAYYDERPATPGKVMSRYGGFLEQIDHFDAAFFGISPREAAKIDPQHRLLMEVAWEAMEDAGLVPASMSEEQKLNIACFIGIITGDYWDRQFQSTSDLDVYATAGSARSGAAGRLSYALNLQGTSFAIDAACSSSLVGIDQAVHSLRAGVYTTALVGGVNIILNPDHTIGFSQGKMMAGDGHCKAFDEKADGYVRSEGAGVVVLKLLSQALADGDHIYALIRGSASNNDGNCNSFMAPSTRGQQAGLRKACRNADINPLSIDYVEAHGPGTRVGDPIEITTLGEVLCQGRSAAHPLLVGSVKTNIGHTEGAAGVAGLIKAVLCLQHETITPNLHFHTPSSAIPWQKYALKIPTELTPWPAREHPHRAAICSYGIAGTNAYVILEEAPGKSQVKRKGTASTTLLPLSARSPEALQALARRYVEFLADQRSGDQLLHNINYTASLRRHHHDYRLAVIGNSRQEISDHLQAYLQGCTSMKLVSKQGRGESTHKIVWVFPGQGSQWFGMGRDLLVGEPIFREVIEECDGIINSYTGWSLLEQLQEEEVTSRLKEIDVIQPTLFAIEIALARLWQSWGIEPDVVVGHSMGEVAAAYIAGALSLQDAAWIICSRSKLLLRTSGQGAMAAVELSLEQARTLVEAYEGRVSVAVSNSFHSTVLSGDPGALAEILTNLEAQGIFGRLVNVDVASHSPQMDPLQECLLEQMQHLQPKKAKISIFSTVKTRYLDGCEMGASYWVENLREPVLFSVAMQHLLEDHSDTFMEMSPHPILVGAMRQTIEHCKKSGLVLSSLQRHEKGRAMMLTSLGSLYVHGCDIHWAGLYADGGTHVVLPGYAWQRQKHWNTKTNLHQSRRISTRRNDGTLAHPLLGEYQTSALLSGMYSWTTQISVDLFPYLSEHCVYDMPVLAGAAYLELSLAAATEVFGTRTFCVTDLVLTKALFFPRGKTQTLQVVLAPDENAQTMVLQFFSRQVDEQTQESSWVAHARALVQLGENVPELGGRFHPAIEDVQRDWTPGLNASDFYRGICARGVQHGPLFQSVAQIWRSPHEVMVRLSMPQALTDELAGYQIHPALMDSILQASIPFLPEKNGDETYVPVAVKQMKLYRKPEAGEALWSHALVRHEDQNAIEADIALLNEHGEVLLEIGAFRLQSLDHSNTQDILQQRLNRLLYAIQWEEQAYIGKVGGIARKNWLIFSDKQVGCELLEQFLLRGIGYTVVTPGQSYRRLGEHEYELSPDTAEDFSLLLEDIYNNRGEQIDGIVYLWGLLIAPSGENEVISYLSRDNQLAGIGVLHLLQAITSTRVECTPRLWLGTRGVHSIEEDDRTTSLLQATLWGMGRVIVYEHANLNCTLLDLDVKNIQNAGRALFAELWSDDVADEVALRGERRYVAKLVHHTLSEKQDETLFRPHGTYLITGGLGGVGLRTARWMVEQGARHLVLLGRHGASEETRAMLDTLEEAGATIAVMQADVSQKEQLAKVLVEIRHTMPPLRGVFHSAVVLDDSTLTQLSQKRFLSVMPPKIDGAWNLHLLTRDDPLDYFVLFSSAASFIGSPGQGNYAAANAFMDQLAYYRRQHGLPAFCLNWGRWGEVGQATKENRGERLDARGFASMKPAEGLTILGHLLRQSPAQVAVMSFDMQKWSQFYPRLAGSVLFTHLVEESRTAGSEAVEHPRLSREMLIELDENQRPHKLGQYLTDQIARVLGHPASLVLDPHQQLSALGIDSLMGVELKNRLHSDLGVAIPAITFLQGTSLAQLIDKIEELF